MYVKSKKGQAMVEFALVLPIFILLVCGILDFAWIYGNQLMANNACREATRYTAIYYSGDLEDSEDIAKDIVTDYAPMLPDPAVNLNEDGEKVSLIVRSEINVLTPVLSTILGETYNIESKCAMRLE